MARPERVGPNCDFGTQTTGFVQYIVVSKKTFVQEIWFTELKDNPEEALKLAIAFEQGAQQKKLFVCKQSSIKEEPVFAVEKNNECCKCEEPFTMGHRKICSGKKTLSTETVEKTRHYARMCRIRQPETTKTPEEK